MLLSRVAEAVYWAGRYLERAESTARIVRVHTDLYLDLPKAAGLTWAPLLAITGTDGLFGELYDEPTEEEVIRFLTYDGRNGGSVVASLAAAREDVRTARPVFPREAWEILNDLYLHSIETCEDAVSRTWRVAWLDRIVADCQRLAGLLAGTMSQDQAYRFLRVGRHLERADLTTRVLDVRASHLMAMGTRLGPYTEVTWMGVLKSLSAYQMYRRTVQARVQGPEALRFLLQDPDFPRSIDHCLTEIGHALTGLGEDQAARAGCEHVQRMVEGAKVRTLAWDGLHDFVDDLQGRLAEVHDAIEASYFRLHLPAAGTDPRTVLASA